MQSFRIQYFRLYIDAGDLIAFVLTYVIAFVLTYVSIKIFLIFYARKEKKIQKEKEVETEVTRIVTDDPDEKIWLPDVIEKSGAVKMISPDEEREDTRKQEERRRIEELLR